MIKEFVLFGMAGIVIIIFLSTIKAGITREEETIFVCGKLCSPARYVTADRGYENISCACKDGRFFFKHINEIGKMDIWD